jgi:hypothetical protein
MLQSRHIFEAGGMEKNSEVAKTKEDSKNFLFSCLNL